MGQALDHHADHGPLHPRLVVFGLAFVVDGQPAALAEPGKGALHDPAARQDREVVDAWRLRTICTASVRTCWAQVTSLPA